MQYAILIFWFVSAIFGNSFLQFKMGPLNPFYVFAFIALFYMLFCFANRTKAETPIVNKKFVVLLTVFTCLDIFYVVLSLLNFSSIFNLDVLYDRSYVFRQGYQIFVVAIGVMTYKAFNVKKTNIVFLRILLLASLVVNFIMVDGIIMHGLFLFLATRLFYEDKKRYNIIYLLVCLIATARMVIGDAMMTYLATYVGTSLCLIYSKLSERMELQNTKRVFEFLFVVVAIALGIIFIPKLISSDANTNWRFTYWMNEFETLTKTGFIGVGFGTSYCTPGFLTTVNNANMFLDNYPTSIFVTTQHSSYINVFYRMGIIGGILFTLIILYPFTLHKKYFRQNKAAFILYYCSLFTVIVNPGLESPRFMIFYVFSLAFLISSVRNTALTSADLKKSRFVYGTFRRADDKCLTNLSEPSRS